MCGSTALRDAGSPIQPCDLKLCESTAAAGISGIDYNFLNGLSPATLQPLLRISKPLVGTSPSSIKKNYMPFRFLTAVALEKGSSGLVPGQALENHCPICIGNSARRLAANCDGAGAKLAASEQCGAEFKNIAE
jgi:hypothetical protein